MQYFEVLKEVVSGRLLESAGLWALLAIIPLILAYLIRPKPRHKTIPALMFLMKDRARADKRSFLRKLLRDPLLLFQIFIIIIFALTLARPFITVKEDVFVENAVILIDNSASSQARIDGTTRFERSINIALDKLSTRNTIISIEANPELVVHDADAAKARSEIERLQPIDTPTAIYDAMMFASNYVSEGDKLFVISDFIDTTGKDFITASRILESKGILVEFINVRDDETRPGKNIGIIDAEVGEEETTVTIKNYNDVEETVGVDIDGLTLSMSSIRIDPKGVESVSFPTQWGLSRFWITPKAGSDDFELDDEIFLSSPSRERAPLLWISNKDSRYLATALDVIGTVDVKRGAPPKVPEVKHQIILIDDINKDLILPGTMRDIRETVEAGSSLVVFAQKDLTDIDFEGLLPVIRVDKSGPVFIEHEVAVVSDADTSITEDIDFGRVDHYLKVKPLDGTTTIASTTNDVPMIVMQGYGDGLVVYFGLMDDYSTFKQDIYFPVFWKRLFDIFLNRQELSELNFRTGKRLALLEERRIEAPKGVVNTDAILLSHQGIYRSDNRNFVANLASDAESDINGYSMKKSIGKLDSESSTEKDIPFELAWYFVLAIIVLVFIELLWIKFRGDL